jgi:hypothetical protein
MAKKTRPMRTSNADGITVKQLLKLLEGANPDAVLWLDAEYGLGKARVAELDAFNPGSKPVVVLKNGG